MKQKRIIQKVIGLTLVFGGFIMSILQLLVDWEILSMPFPKVFINFFLIPMWIGIVIYQYRPGLSLTTKKLSWASIVLFIISLLPDETCHPSHQQIFPSAFSSRTRMA